MSAKRSVVLFVVFLCLLLPLYAQPGRQFTVPMNDLKTWADKPTATLQVRVSGYSSVHALQNDCEIHLGGKADRYAGDPDGWVLEPMNACLEPLPGNAIYFKSAWLLGQSGHEHNRDRGGSRPYLAGTPHFVRSL